MIDFKLWPPTNEDRIRLASYVRGQQIFEGHYKECWDRKSAQVQDGQVLQYSGADWGALICRVVSDMLFGETPVLQAGQDQAQLQAIVDDCGLWSVLLEASLACSFRGDCVLRVVWDPEDQRVELREIPAGNYFVELDPDDCRKVRSQAIAWLRRVSEKEAYLRVDHYNRTTIVREAYSAPALTSWGHQWAWQQMGQMSLRRVPLAQAYPGEVAPPETEPTLLPQYLWHIPNVRHGSHYWGSSEFSGGMESLLDSYNERLSEIHRALSKHSDPKVLLPEGVLDNEGNVNWRQLGAIELPPGTTSDAIKYLVWDPQLIPAFKELEVLGELIYKTSEISPAIFGEDKAGSIESGRAMRFRFMRTLSKIARRRLYWDKALREILVAMQSLAAVYGQKYGDGLEVVEPREKVSIIWQDGLPEDALEAIQAEVQRVDAGLSSRLMAISRIDRITLAEAQDDLDRMMKEQNGSQQSTDPDPAPGGPPEPAAAGAAAV